MRQRARRRLQRRALSFTMLALAQWLSQTRASLALQDLVWLVPLVQTIHILAIAMVLSSVLMIALRILRFAAAQPMIETAHRFVPWIWSGLLLLAGSGATLIVAEPQRALPNPVFQIKMALLALAVTITIAFQMSLRRRTALWADNARAPRFAAVLAVATFALWCAIAAAGRWIAYIKAG
jgi:hypothetical protein